MTRLRVTRRGAFVAGVALGVLVAALWCVLEENYRECISRGYSVATCAE